MVARNDNLHLTYLDSDAIVAATLEPTAREHLQDLRSTSYVALSFTVVHEIAVAGPRKRRRLVETAIQVADGYSTDQAPEVLREVLVRPPIPASVSRQLRGIGGLEVLLEANPNPGEFFSNSSFSHISGDSLVEIMRGSDFGTRQEKDLPFQEFFFQRARAYVMMLAEGVSCLSRKVTAPEL